METRKIQLAGGTTYTVSIPKEWASEHDLEAGATVRIDPHADGSLVVRTNGHRHADADPRTVEVGDTDPDTLCRQVGAAYRTGHDAVVLTSDEGFGVDQQAAIRAAAQDLLGVDVVEATDDRIVCKSLLDTTDVSVEQSLHQLQYAALSAHRDAVAALRGDHDELRSIDDREAEAARLVALVARQFERALVDPAELDDLAVTRSTLFDYHTTARQLARVATHAGTVATVARRRDEPVTSTTASFVDAVATDVHDLLERATGILLDGADLDAACAVLADADALTDSVTDQTLAPETLAGESPVELATVAHALAASADCGGSIADVAVRAAARTDGR